jgi:error-prone DNA polymerase
MGFYSSATLVKDARRHGVKMRPVSVAESEWRCTVESDDVVRLGFCVVNGLRQEHGEEIVRQRKLAPFRSLADFKGRVCLTKEELRTLAELGALNCFAQHRRAALWKVEEEAPGPLFVLAGGDDPGPPEARRPVRPATPRCNDTAPLAPMTLPERVQSDYEGMNLTTGPHPMKLLREQLPEIWRASDLATGAP